MGLSVIRWWPIAAVIKALGSLNRIQHNRLLQSNHKAYQHIAASLTELEQAAALASSRLNECRGK